MNVEAEQKRPDALAESVLRAAGMSVDDLKSLETVFRDLAASFGTRVAAHTEVVVSAEFVDTKFLERDDIQTTLSQSCLVALAPVVKWGSRVILTADRNFVDCSVDALFGAGQEAAVPERRLTSIDLGVARQIFADMAAALDHLFAGGAEPLFQIGDVVETAHLAPNAVAETRMICSTVMLKVAGRSGRIDVLMPRSGFRPMQETIARLLHQPGHPTDPAWAKKLRLEVSRAHIEVEAYLQQGSMTLEQLSYLRPGQVLQLPKGAIDQVRLRSGKQGLYKCRLGKAGTAFTVRITDPVNEEEDLLDELAAG